MITKVFVNEFSELEDRFERIVKKLEVGLRGVLSIKHANYAEKSSYAIIVEYDSFRVLYPDHSVLSIQLSA